MRNLLASSVLLLAACHAPVAGSPLPYDGSDGAASPECVTDCAIMADAGCPLGSDPDCPVTCTTSEGTVTGMTVDWPCIGRSRSAADIRLCDRSSRKRLCPVVP